MKFIKIIFSALIYIFAVCFRAIYIHGYMQIYYMIFVGIFGFFVLPSIGYENDEI